MVQKPINQITIPMQVGDAILLRNLIKMALENKYNDYETDERIFLRQMMLKFDGAVEHHDQTML